MSQSGSTPGREQGIHLSRLLAASSRGGIQFIGADDIVVTRCTDDADECRRGDLFVARTNARGDGHDQVRRAVARGATGVIAERMVPTGGVPLCLVRSSDRAFALVAQALAGHPADRMRVIAVTGTSGKTTTAWLTASVLAEAGLDVGVLSDLGCLGRHSRLTDAGDCGQADVLAARLAGLAAEGCTHAVVEVSSRMLAADVLAGVPCDTVVVPTIASAHLDRHGSAAAYRRITMRILDRLAAVGCLVAGGSGRLEGLVRRATARQRIECLTAGTTSRCDVRARLVERSLHGQTFLLSAGGHVLTVSVPTPVTSFARNAACAAAVGLRYGVDAARIARGLQSAGSLPHRVERLDRGQDATIFLDTATSGHALASTLRSLRRLTPGRLAVVAEDSPARGGEAARIRREVRRWCDQSVTVPVTLLAEDAGAADVAAYARVDRLLSSLGRGDCLLVLGRMPDSRGGPAGPAAAVPLARVIDGWLQAAHPPRVFGRRRAA
jgi:UDP-N-acetylmuramoyl-L-alanyl-D-glutamate--2,6-diaminopimelate ligase